MRHVVGQVLSSPVREDTLELRCAAFIAVGKLGSAVGAAQFGGDASAVMQAIFQVHDVWLLALCRPSFETSPLSVTRKQRP